MTKAALAKALRARQFAKKIVSPELLRAVPDDDLIMSYVTCACCRNVQVTPAQLSDAIERATDDDHFFAICDGHGPLHRASTAQV